MTARRKMAPTAAQELAGAWRSKFVAESVCAGVPACAADPSSHRTSQHSAARRRKCACTYIFTVYSSTHAESEHNKENRSVAEQVSRSQRFERLAAPPNARQALLEYLALKRRPKHLTGGKFADTWFRLACDGATAPVAKGISVHYIHFVYGPK